MFIRLRQQLYTILFIILQFEIYIYLSFLGQNSLCFGFIVLVLVCSIFVLFGLVMIDRMMDGPGLVGSCPGVSEGDGQGVHLIFHKYRVFAKNQLQPVLLLQSFNLVQNMCTRLLFPILTTNSSSWEGCKI